MENMAAENAAPKLKDLKMQNSDVRKAKVKKRAETDECKQTPKTAQNDSFTHLTKYTGVTAHVP